MRLVPESEMTKERTRTALLGCTLARARGAGSWGFVVVIIAAIVVVVVALISLGMVLLGHNEIECCALEVVIHVGVELVIITEDLTVEDMSARAHQRKMGVKTYRFHQRIRSACHRGKWKAISMRLNTTFSAFQNFP